MVVEVLSIAACFGALLVAFGTLLYEPRKRARWQRELHEYDVQREQEKRRGEAIGCLTDDDWDELEQAGWDAAVKRREAQEAAELAKQQPIFPGPGRKVSVTPPGHEACIAQEVTVEDQAEPISWIWSCGDSGAHRDG